MEASGIPTKFVVPSSHNTYDPIPISAAEANDPFGYYPPPFSENDLFSPTGWGPKTSVKSAIPKQYIGPAYPAPMKVQAADSPDKSQICERARKAWSMCEADHARELYDEATKIDASDVNLWFERAQLLWACEDYDSAEENIRQALKLNPDHIPSYVTLIRLRTRVGDLSAFGVLMGSMFLTPEGEIDNVRRALCYEMQKKISYQR